MPRAHSGDLIVDQTTDQLRKCLIGVVSGLELEARGYPSATNRDALQFLE
jgi:hypothetical protein